MTRQHSAPHILIIDNYDSFVHNLARYVQLAGGEVTILRNDEKSVKDIIAMQPDGIIISPGPKAPQDAGICIDLIRTLGATTPILGVCLGHQAIGEAYGGSTVQTPTPTHGAAATVTHDASALFKNIPSPFEAGLYHSLITDISNTADLTATAHTDDRLMAIAHTSHPVYGIQFHPESILTPQGQHIIKNFINIVLGYEL